MNSDEGPLFLDPATAHPADLRVARRLDDLRKKQAARMREIKSEMSAALLPPLIKALGEK
jgi:hypothetical protein